MIIQAVPRLRETLGDEGVGELITLVDDRVREQAASRDEFQQVIIRLDTLEQNVGQLRREMIDRFTRIDDRFIEMDRHFESRFEEMNRHFESRFEQMEQRLEVRLLSQFEGRFQAIDQRFDQIDQRLDRMDQRLDRMDQRFDKMDQRLDQMYDRMLVQSRWLIGSIALLGTVISLLLAIGQFIR